MIKKLDKVYFFKKQQVPLSSSQPSAEPLENIALGKRVTQSSTAFGGDARRAVDGKLDGNYGHNSVTHTDFQSKPWWQVDLDKEETIRQINIYNRTDAAQDRLTNFNVILLDSSGKEIERKRIAYLRDSFAQISIDYKKARFVRIELDGYTLSVLQKFRFSVLRISHGKSKLSKVLLILVEMLVVPWMAIPIVVIASNQLPIQNLKTSLGGKLI